jgi:cytosine/adenosine deaminase-related metal-dependent hydrolase
MLAARQQDAESLRQHYASAAEIILCIDGLQPEKGHETLYVVRELTRKRVWFAEPLLSATEDEVRRLIQKAKEWTQSLGTSVGLWMSDKQEAFVTAIAAEFPDVPHRYCDDHFLRDLAKPVLEADSHAQVRMRKKVRGLRTIERAVLQRQKTEAKEGLTPQTPEVTGTANTADLSAAGVDPVGSVVLDYCAAVRGVLNDDQGGPLHPPGLRMAEALTEVRESIQRSLEAKRGDSRRSNSAGCRDASRRAWTKSRSSTR